MHSDDGLLYCICLFVVSHDLWPIKAPLPVMTLSDLEVDREDPIQISSFPLLITVYKP